MSKYFVTEMLTYEVEADSQEDAVALVYNNLGELPEDTVRFDYCDVQPHSESHHTYTVLFCDSCRVALGQIYATSQRPPHVPMCDPCATNQAIADYLAS